MSSFLGLLLPQRCCDPHRHAVDAGGVARYLIGQAGVGCAGELVEAGSEAIRGVG
ncbi:MAG: hypothetical protein MK141_14520 [Pseudoxanthomonas sp.]|jgi:hypothetical protein|uniref:hypothetical protein n=1 Tax=Pseudoxanthomonas sp. TaxID=1871049 RepID=UPI00258744AA|nr:hypothetical protein [Pseudoxanthomonas sp.]MCH2092774.1 hypothetical protein [Pseudoxanthomonas sp.]